MELVYDDTTLRNLWHMLSERERKKALLRSVRDVGGIVRRSAQQAVGGSGIRNAAKMRKNIRLNVFKTKLGFKVYVGNRGRKSMYKNSRAEEKPLAFWFNIGTGARTTKNGSEAGFKRRAARSRKSHPTGSLRAFEFIKSSRGSIDTAQRAMEGKVLEWVTRVAAQH